MNGARWLVEALSAEKVDTLFGYPGGAIMPFYDALYGCPLKHVLVRHEQGAAFAANGYARASGRVGVCIATSGPGATNLVTGIADAMLDSVPMVVITGQVATTLMGTDAFQEVDVFGMTLPVVKHSFIPRSVDQLPEVVREAFRLARSGRPGPVLIDLPKDVQLATAAHLPAHVPAPVDPNPPATNVDLVTALELLSKARRPVVYGGGGIALGDAVAEFRTFVESIQVPTVLTLRGLGALPDAHPLNLGMLGMHGTRAANMAVQEADLLVVVGARFDDRATGRLDQFAPIAKVIHLDVDPAEFNKLRHCDAVLHGELQHSLNQLATAMPECSTWRTTCQSRKRQYAARYDAPTATVYAPALLRRLSELAPAAVVSCDVGQHQMWVAQHWGFNDPRKHLTSGGLGAMGFGLPAAIGAQMADPQAQVFCVSGDGSFLMNVQELATVVRYRLPVKIVLLDNQRLGMVRQWQELFFEHRYSETDLSDNPDFVAVAEAFGIQAFALDRADDCESALQRLIAAPGPALLHVSIDAHANVWPLVPPNHNNAQMLHESTAPRSIPGANAAAAVASHASPAHAGVVHVHATPPQSAHPENAHALPD
ncbi:acetolactate synthase 2 catalytic subunit [Lysobacter avium]|uniref:Acetolactate synthase n=1 Tax=Novilysobacter avium TaxID=2781023 RepID=A0A7S6ULN7_9GAMM|nr:acetolactate synthase 2 catalytic subunit [Lysobacter avium]QOW25083.1 acetolactate synthase 2 catalytic subunit [Lysobacter sp. H23M47]